MKKNQPKGKKGKWISAHQRLSTVVSNEAKLIGYKKVNKKIPMRKIRKRRTGRIKKQPKTRHLLDTKILEDSCKRKFYVYN